MLQRKNRRTCVQETFKRRVTESDLSKMGILFVSNRHLGYDDNEYLTQLLFPEAVVKLLIVVQ